MVKNGSLLTINDHRQLNNKWQTDASDLIASCHWS